jgi:hypothetical protein
MGRPGRRWNNQFNSPNLDCKRRRRRRRRKKKKMRMIMIFPLCVHFVNITHDNAQN